MEEESWIDTATTMFQPAPQSVAETLLAKVFGNWVIDESSGRGTGAGPLIYDNFMGLDEVTLLSTLLGYSGTLAAAFGLIITSYTFIMQMVKNSWQGTFSAEGINSIFWPARTVAALALIVPIVTIGTGDRTTSIAASQVLMMDIAKAGSGFADSVTASYVTNAFAFPVNNARPPDRPDAVFEMLKIASCSLFGAYYEGESQAPHAQVIQAVTRDGTVTAYLPTKYLGNDSYQDFQAAISNASNGKKTLARASTIDAAIESAFNTSNLRKIIFGNNGQCGSISFVGSGVTDIDQRVSGGRGFTTSNTGRDDATKSLMSVVQNRVGNAYRPALKTLTKSVFGFVERSIDSERYEVITEEFDTIDAATSTEARVFFQMILNFNTDLYTKIANSINQVSDELGGTMFAPIINGGWAALGAVYSVIPRISSLAVSNTATAHGQVSAGNQDFECSTSESSWTDSMSAYFFGCEASENMVAYASGVERLTRKYRASYSDSGKPQISVLDYCTIDECNVRAAESSAAMTISKVLLDGLQGAGDYLNNDAGMGTGESNTQVRGNEAGNLGDRTWQNTRDPNPITTLSAMGSSMQALGMAYQALGFTVEVAKGSMEEAQDGQEGGVIKVASGVITGAIAQALAALAEFLSTLSLLLIATGFYLTYILPMIPFIIFVMQVVGWLATTIEGMFASTFAIALLTNSDGDGAINTGFLKAISLTAAIFLRPFFIVIGVAVSHAIAAPSFGFFNEQFWRAWEVDNALGGDVSNVIFEVSAQIMLYVISATILVRFIYSVQHIIPDSMNNWVAGGIVNPFGVGDAGDKVVSGVTGRAENITNRTIGAANAAKSKQ